MTMHAHERLDAEAGTVTNHVSDKLLAPLSRALSELEGVFPGISERVTSIIDPERIRSILSSEAAQSIKGLIDQGTESSLTNALAAIAELRTFAETRETPEIRRVHEIMGDKFVGPDAWIFRGKDIGEIPALPANIVEILNSRCELTNDGRPVSTTHRLVLLPASIDGRRLSLNSLPTFAEELRSSSDEVSPPAWKYNYDIKTYPTSERSLRKSTWVLLYEDTAPGSFYRTDEQQLENAMKNLPNHRTAKALELVGAMIFNFLEYGERIHLNQYSRCEDQTFEGRKVGAHFTGRQISINYVLMDSEPASRAIVRKLFPTR